MRRWFGTYFGGVVLINCVILVASESYYSIIAPGIIKSNHDYMVVVSLHEANEPAKINLRIEGPFYFMTNDVYLQPYETQAVVFKVQKLSDAKHTLVAEGLSGIIFRNETKLLTRHWAGPKIYIQTDKGVYKPGDEVQFRIVMLDVHTRPLKIEEPIRVKIMDGNNNRVKQFKDIVLVKGIYKNKFQLSEHPVLGDWHIEVSISGKYDYSTSKKIRILKYVLPKFSVYIKIEGKILRESPQIKAIVYGKYTFDKYVEGNVTAKLIETWKDTVIQQKQLNIKDTLTIEFPLDAKDLKDYRTLRLEVVLTEKNTGISQQDWGSIYIEYTRYRMFVNSDQIQYQNGIPYRLKLNVVNWNDSPVLDRTTPVIMQHGAKEYTANVDGSSQATFEFDYDRNSNYVFRFQNVTYTLPNIFVDVSKTDNSTAEFYSKLKLKGDSRPRLGTPVEIEVTSIANIPYLVYTIVGHANIIHADHITLEPNQKSYTIRIIPSIEMVPYAFVYVHYVQNGELRYEEMKLTFPLEFENKISVIAPKQVKPGQEVTLELKAQPKSYVGVLAVDLGVYLLDSSYDLQRGKILSDLQFDVSDLPFLALVYPGLESGVVTFTNAHYKFVPLTEWSAASPASVGPLRFRKKFPETWIFQNYEITNETTKLTLKIPETITTWRITAFSIHDVTGFGIVDGPTDITTIQPFFISLSLPYSVKRGEIVAIPILVYNYQEQSLDSEITLFNQDGEFYFLESSKVNADAGTEQQQMSKRVVVPPNGVESVSFLINPKQVGELSLRVTATNPISSDAVIQMLKVEPEGTAKRHNKALYISVPKGEKVRTSLPVNIPGDIVPNSEFVELSVGGDSLVPALKNLNSLVLLPTGCGEQNMVNFAPNILVLQYLKATGKYFKERELVSKAKRFIDIGYQQQLSYRHDNGGYSVFGQRKDGEASTWLTAYVIRFFIKATKYLALEGHIVGSGLEYLAGAQLADGSFPYTGYLFYPAQQNRFGFTAFVLMTFMEDRKFAMKYETAIQNGLKFLNSNLDKVNDIYALSIMAVTLQMAKHTNAQKILDKLQLQRNNSTDHIWWSQGDRNREKDVEITAYVLMALLDGDNDPQDDLKILKWLTEQRNERGGFKSTHDTVVGLQALVKYSNKYDNVDNMNLKVQYSAKNNESTVLKTGELLVDANNLLILQTEEFPISTRSIDIEASGTGHSLLQLSYHYYVTGDDDMKHFQIQTQPKMLNSDEMLLDVCFTYKNPNIGSSATNMIIMEANLPSGFTSSAEFSNDLLENDIIERVESKNSESTIIIYFEKLSANIKNCVNILGNKIHDVVMRKPAAVAVYDYYNISRQNTAFYSI